MPIELPEDVDVTLGEDEVTVHGPKGTLRVPVSSRLEVLQADGALTLERSSEHRNDRAHHGLARSLIANAVTGVSEGFSRNLEIQGVGYRCALEGRRLELTLGFSHPVFIEPPEGVTIEAPEQTKITVSGIDKQAVGQVAANIRAVRPPDSYHGKGVRYEGETIRLKPGKAAVSAAG
jgi:large subunit ribosomal protein L6